MAFPLVYGFFLVTSIGWTLRPGVAPTCAWQRLNLVPVAAVAFDFLENTATSLVMARYPADMPLAAALAPWFTRLKWVFEVGSFGVLVVVALSVLAQGLCRHSRPV